MHALLACHETELHECIIIIIIIIIINIIIISPLQSLGFAAVLIDQCRTHVVYREHGCSA